MKPKQPLSVLTAIAYPAAGWVGASTVASPESYVFATFMLALGFGTGWLHWTLTARASKADQITMHGVFAGLVILAVSGPWWLMLAGGVAAGFFLEYRYNLQLNPTMGVYVAILVAALLSQTDIIALLSFLIPMGAAKWFHSKGGDGPHAVWHVLTGLGILNCFLALSGHFSHLPF